MKHLLLLTAAASLLATGAEAQAKKAPAKKTPAKNTVVTGAAKGFKKTSSGLEYKFYRDAPGTKMPHTGDFVEMHIRTHIGDSMLYDSRKLNNNQPVPFQVQQGAFKGDLTEGFMMMTVGDSATFRVPVDSILKMGVQALPWMKKGAGMKIEYDVVMTSVKTGEEMRAEAEQKMAEQKLVDEKGVQDYFTQNKITAATKTASGLYYKINEKGTGVMPVAGDSVSMNYTGRTTNGTVFDSNVDPKFQHVQPFWFTLGRHQVIPGWDEGIALLPKGSKATLYIPSYLAYGAQSPSPLIPANSILIFDVEVVDVHPAAK